jgi:hypothetical protein
MGPLDGPFGGWRVCTNIVDDELVQYSATLRVPGTTGS